MKKVRRGHILHIIIYLCVFVFLLICEVQALKSLFNSYPKAQELTVEKITKPIISTNEITVEQAVFPRTHEVQMNAVEITYE